MDCSKPENYWLAWSKNAARLGLGLYPGENEVENLIIRDEVRPRDLHVVFAVGLSMDANWTIYRHTDFDSKFFCSNSPVCGSGLTNPDVWTVGQIERLQVQEFLNVRTTALVCKNVVSLQMLRRI